MNTLQKIEDIEIWQLTRTILKEIKGSIKYINTLLAESTKFKERTWIKNNGKQ